MSSLAFDTHKAVKSLTEAGAGEPLAEAVVATIGVAVGVHMASKADLKDLGKDTKADLKDLGKDLNARMDSLEQGLNARMDSLEQGLNARMDSLEQDLNARMDSLEQDLNARMDRLEQSMKTLGKTTKADLEKTKRDIIIYIGGMLFGSVGILATLIGFF